MSSSDQRIPDDLVTVHFTDPQSVTVIGEKRRQVDSQEPTVLFGRAKAPDLADQRQDRRRVLAMREALQARQAQRQNLARHLEETLTEEERAHPVKLPTDPPMEG